MAITTAVRHLGQVFGDQTPSMAQLAADQQDFLRDASDRSDRRYDLYTLYEEYYDGDQKCALDGRAKQYLEASGLPFAENFCNTVTDTHASALRVQAFEVEDNEAATAWLNNDWWGRGRLAELQDTVHHNMLLLGDAIVIVDWDRATARPVPYFNHPLVARAFYDSNGRLQYLSKVWDDERTSPQNPRGDKIRRLNIYWPDRIEKWFTPSKGQDSTWAPYVDPDDFDEKGSPTWPVPWTTTGRVGGEPLGLNTIHFRHAALGKENGRSILRNVIPQQDGLTKQILDLFEVMDKQGWPQRWGTGLGPDADLEVAIGELLSGPDGANFGEFTPANPLPLQGITEGTLKRISARSATPLHDLIVGEFPAGEALKTAEGAKVAAGQRRWEPTGNSWEDTARCSWRLSAAWGSGPHKAPPFDETAVIKVRWEPIETRNDLNEVTVLALEVDGLGLSKTTALRQRGYDPDEQAKLVAREVDDAQARMPDVPEPDRLDEQPPPAVPAA